MTLSVDDRTESEFGAPFQSNSSGLFPHGLKVEEDEALQSNPRFWELIENARTAGKG